MTAILNNHIHLGESEPTGSTTSDEWLVAAPEGKPSMVPIYRIMSSPAMSLSGKFRPGVLHDSAGAMRQRGWALSLLLSSDTALDSYNNMETILGYMGELLWFVPLKHDVSDHDPYNYQVYLLSIGEARVSSYLYRHIELPITVMEAT